MIKEKDFLQRVSKINPNYAATLSDMPYNKNYRVLVYSISTDRFVNFVSGEYDHLEDAYYYREVPRYNKRIVADSTLFEVSCVSANLGRDTPLVFEYKPVRGVIVCFEGLLNLDESVVCLVVD